MSIRFTARVPYHGLVEWAATDVDRYADSLRAEHRPHRSWLPGRGPSCECCADAWPCTAYQWADQWSHTPSRVAAHASAHPEAGQYV